MGVEEKERLIDELEAKLIKAFNPFSMLADKHLQEGGMKPFYKDYYIIEEGKDKAIESVDLQRREFLPLLDHVIKYCPSGYRRGYKK